jgi:hypothetical protein
MSQAAASSHILATASPGAAPRVRAPLPRSSSASPAGRQDAARSARSADLSSAASPYTGTDSPSHAACPCTGTITVATAATANAAGGWARAIAAASGRARYRAK